MILSQTCLLFYLFQSSLARTTTTNARLPANVIDLLPPYIPLPTMPATLLPLIRKNPTFPEPTATTTPSPGQALQQNPACALLGSALTICNSLTPGFNTLPPTSQAHCLCYSSTSWMPAIFDGAVKTCADFASTAVSEAYTPLEGLEGFCGGLGDVENQNPVPTTTGSGYGGGDGQCSSVQEILSACESSTSGWSTLLPKDQASCLCYTSSAWCPSVFDNVVGSCVAYAMTADTSAWSAVSAMVGFCDSVGILTTSMLASYVVPTTLSAVASQSATAPRSTGSGWGGGTATVGITATTITIGAAHSTGGVAMGHSEWSEGAVVGFSFLCALLVLFL